jgi:DNA-binding MarR family transcriptional regulator
MARQPLDKKIIDGTMESLLYVMPVINKKLMTVDVSRLSRDFRLSRLHVMIMGNVENNKKMRASEIGREFMILKPQMTRLIKELVKAGMVEQTPDISDKRAKYVVLTDQGRLTLNRFQLLLKKRIAVQLSAMGPAEMKEFLSLVSKLKSMAVILEKHGK